MPAPLALDIPVRRARRGRAVARRRSGLWRSGLRRSDKSFRRSLDSGPPNPSGAGAPESPATTRRPDGAIWARRVRISIITRVTALECCRGGSKFIGARWASMCGPSWIRLAPHRRARRHPAAQNSRARMPPCGRCAPVWPMACRPAAPIRFTAPNAAPVFALAMPEASDGSHRLLAMPCRFARRPSSVRLMPCRQGRGALRGMNRRRDIARRHEIARRCGSARRLWLRRPGAAGGVSVLPAVPP